MGGNQWARKKFARLVSAFCKEATKVEAPLATKLHLPVEDMKRSLDSVEPLLQLSSPFYSLNTKATVTRFFSFILDHLMEDTRKHWRRFGEFFGLINDFAAQGHEQRELLAAKCMVARALEYYMGEFSPYRAEPKKRTLIKDTEDSPANLQPLFSICATLCENALPLNWLELQEVLDAEDRAKQLATKIQLSPQAFALIKKENLNT